MVASLLVTLLVATADPRPPRSAPPITPPVAPRDTNVAYPRGGTGDSVVLLELVVANDGTVADAKVIEGAEPFAEQARRAVLTLAVRAGDARNTPVAARIRARVEFHQESTAAARLDQPAGAADGTAPQPAPRAARASARSGRGAARRDRARPATRDRPDDALRRRRPRDAGRVRRSLPRDRSAARRSRRSSAGCPTSRSAARRPTTTATTSTASAFRSCSTSASARPWFIPALIDRVDFFPGAAPAAYGDAAGAIIAGQTRAPATKTHGEANLRLFDAGALAETPFGDGRGSVLARGAIRIPGPGPERDHRQREARLLGLPGARDVAARRSRHARRLRLRQPRLPGHGAGAQRQCAGRSSSSSRPTFTGRPALRPRAGRRHAADRRDARSRRAGRRGPQRERRAHDDLRFLGGEPDRARRQAVAVAARPRRRVGALRPVQLRPAAPPTPPGAGASTSADPPPTNADRGAPTRIWSGT